jgi:hypothetical protein
MKKKILKKFHQYRIFSQFFLFSTGTKSSEKNGNKVEKKGFLLICDLNKIK